VKITVIGAGLMGAQIGCEYALGGHDVTLVARRPGLVEERVEAAIGLLEEHRLATPAEIAAARERISVTATLAGEGLAACELAVESVPEELELKADLLGSVAAAAPGAILASNTSSISITTLGDAVGAPERVVGTHYLNPPLLMPPVELVAGERTRPGVVETVRQLLSGLGKLPVLVRRDVPGFVWNRLQFALVRECAWLVDSGVASAAEVDTVVREGLARRWRRVGPFAAIALGGVDTWQRAATNLVPELAVGDDLGDLRRFGGADAAELARLRAERDRALAAELRSGPLERRGVERELRETPLGNGEDGAGDAFAAEPEQLVGETDGVRRQDDVVEREQRVIGAERLVLEDVEGRPGDRPPS
jgi:3-hydroxybutyryl-CoA dehydrogenase